MSNLIRSIMARTSSETRFDPLSWSEFVNYFTYNGLSYPTLNLTMPETPEVISPEFGGFVETVYRRNGVVVACMFARARLFSEARFQYRRYRNGRPGELFGDSGLSLLWEPWPGGTTGDLLSRAITDADLAGNAFFARRPGGLRRLRPDWVRIILGTRRDFTGEIDADWVPVGYVYQPGGPNSGKDPVTLTADEVAHFYPIPDGAAPYRGMSWLTPLIREIASDSAATTHKLKFFENAGTPNLVVKLPEATGTRPMTPEAFNRWVELFEEQHTGYLNAYRTLYLGGGADVDVVGKDLQQLDFKVTQGAGETRIAAAAGIHPVIVGLSEGLQGASLNAGNFASARRLVADGTLRPLWRNFAASMSTVVPVPAGAELTYDDRDIAFLREDRKDAAEIQATKTRAIRQLVDAGFTPESVVKAVEAEDLTLLDHTGLYSVQLQPPQTTVTPSSEQAASRALVAAIQRQFGNGDA